MNSMKDCYELENGVKIPCMGYGTYKAAEGNNEGIIKTAIEAGTEDIHKQNNAKCNE